MVIHNFRTVVETGYLLLVMFEKGGQCITKSWKLTCLSQQSLTLSWVEAASLYKTNNVIKLKVKANDVPDIVDRPQRERYNPQHTCKFRARVSVHCWGWISHEGAGVFHHIEGHLDGLHYQHILQNVTVPSLWIRGLLEKYPTVFCYVNTWWIII